MTEEIKKDPANAEQVCTWLKKSVESKGGKTMNVRGAEWGTVKRVIQLLGKYKEMDERSGQDTTKQQIKIYEQLKAMGYTGAQEDLMAQADYWGMCEVISPTYEVSNHGNSQWMYILTNNQDIARDYKAVFEWEYTGGWDGDKNDYIEYLRANENLEALDVKPREIWSWANQNNIAEKDYDKVLELFLNANEGNIENYINEDKFMNYVSDSVSWFYEDITSNYGAIGDAKGENSIDSYAGRGMTSTASEFGAEDSIIEGIPVGGKLYIVKGDGWVKKLYCNIKTV